jgi:hypothetical protein
MRQVTQLPGGLALLARSGASDLGVPRGPREEVIAEALHSTA